mmetsp:Transcript_30631/g.88395  ORF Transcript_30631/g.88395 Transcript_30631/m.88395 type:complete len:226 (+) Transcript_30631:458-1135(+)
MQAPRPGRLRGRNVIRSLAAGHRVGLVNLAVPAAIPWPNAGGRRACGDLVATRCRWRGHLLGLRTGQPKEQHLHPHVVGRFRRSTGRPSWLSACSGFAIGEVALAAHQQPVGHKERCRRARLSTSRPAKSHCDGRYRRDVREGKRFEISQGDMRPSWQQGGAREVAGESAQEVGGGASVAEQVSRPLLDHERHVGDSGAHGQALPLGRRREFRPHRTRLGPREGL